MPRAREPFPRTVPGKVHWLDSVRILPSVVPTRTDAPQVPATLPGCEPKQLILQPVPTLPDPSVAQSWECPSRAYAQFTQYSYSGQSNPGKTLKTPAWPARLPATVGTAEDRSPEGDTRFVGAPAPIGPSDRHTNPPGCRR